MFDFFWRRLASADFREVAAQIRPVLMRENVEEAPKRPFHKSSGSAHCITG
jgi:hypothetical protein